MKSDEEVSRVDLQSQVPVVGSTAKFTMGDVPPLLIILLGTTVLVLGSFILGMKSQSPFAVSFIPTANGGAVTHFNGKVTVHCDSGQWTAENK